MDVELENAFKSPPLDDKKSKNRVSQASEASGSTKEPKRTKTMANKKKSSSQLTIELAKSPEKENQVSIVGNADKQPTMLVNQVKFSSSRPEMVLFKSSSPLPLEARTEGSQHATDSWRNILTLGFGDSDLLTRGSSKNLAKRSYELLHQASLFSYVTHHRSSQQAKLLETEPHQTRDHRETLAKKWNDSEAEVSRTEEEAKKQCLADQKKIKELEDSLKSFQADHDKNLKEMDAETKDWVNSIGRKTIYQIWSANPNLHFSFLGDNADAMLAFCKKTRREELGEEEEV
uniref:Uncharacterized protein n=1 Tax=Cannabis sativa TaxID=3483 RepID=A0A803Q701_CANSA